jgi:hypothetical protein
VEESPKSLSPKRRPNRLEPLPNIWDALRADPILLVDPKALDVQLRDARRWTRKYLLPLIRVGCLSAIFIVRILRRLSPFQFQSQWILNVVSILFARRVVSPEALYLLIRHFHVESNLINFVARNAGGSGIEEAGNKPSGPDQLGDVDGVNATILHDANMFNFIVDIGHAQGANLTQRIPLEDIDFSSLQFKEPEINPKGRILNLDFESTLYLIVAFMTTFLNEDTAESAANSLELDESLLHIIANYTGDERFRNWAPLKFPNYIQWPKDVGRSLFLHILALEYAHTRLLQLKDEQAAQTDTP